MLIKASLSGEVSPDAQRQDRKGDYRRTLQGVAVCAHTESRVTTLIGNKGWNRWAQRLAGLTM